MIHQGARRPLIFFGIYLAFLHLGGPETCCMSPSVSSVGAVQKTKREKAASCSFVGFLGKTREKMKGKNGWFCLSVEGRWSQCGMVSTKLEQTLRGLGTLPHQSLESQSQISKAKVEIWFSFWM